MTEAAAETEEAAAETEERRQKRQLSLRKFDKRKMVDRNDDSDVTTEYVTIIATTKTLATIVTMAIIENVI